MKLRNFIEEKVSDWIWYKRPAVDWMTTENGKPNSRLKRTLHDFPEFAKLVGLIPRPLDRQQIGNCFKEDLYKGFVATLLWDSLHKEFWPIHLQLPFLAEPASEIRRKLAIVKEYLDNDDASLSEVFSALYDPSKLLFARGINFSRFTLAMDCMTVSPITQIHPLLYNNRMKSIHCALLLEDEGTSQPYYDIEEGKISIGKNTTLAACYEDYCQRLGDIALWAGTGNPEFLVDWMNYSDDGRATYAISREVIWLFEKTNKNSTKTSLTSLGNALSLAEFNQQGFAYSGDDDKFFANMVFGMYLDLEADRICLKQIMEENNIIMNRTTYGVYSQNNKGCSIKNPFSLNAPWPKRLLYENVIVDFLLFWSNPAETHRELSRSSMLFRHTGEKIECKTFDVYREGKKHKETYYFDVTKMFNEDLGQQL